MPPTNRPDPQPASRLRRLLRYLPTALTIGNSLCGFGAILQTLQVYYPEPGREVPEMLATSAWLIIGAMLFDMLDGWTARRLNATSRHGMEMDSLADMVTFGVAPAVMVAVMGHACEIAWPPYRTVWVLSAVYLACVASRLALYNVLASDGDGGDAFHGLPSPGAAAAVASLVILYSHSEFAFVLMAQLLPLYAALLGLLMVSPIPYAHVGKWLGRRRHWHLKLLLLIAFFLVFSWRSRLVAAIAVNAYVLSGPLCALWAWVRFTPEPAARPAA